jgi:superoxide reductase
MSIGEMNMSKAIFYRCEKCGNIVAKVQDGGGTLTCCGQEMTALKANTTDASQEKHVPAITREDGKIKVSVGSVLHPSLPEHYIQWIALVTEDKVELVYLQPGMEPRAEFNEVESGTIYEYCNLHSLWKSEF